MGHYDASSVAVGPEPDKRQAVDSPGAHSQCEEPFTEDIRRPVDGPGWKRDLGPSL